MVGFLTVPIGAAASPEDLGPPTFRACAPAPQLSSIVSALAGSGGSSSLRRLSDRDVKISGSDGAYEVRTDQGTPVRVTTAVHPLACAAIAADAVRLANGGHVPGADIAAVGAVLAYRDKHAWPYGSAHLDDPRTTVAFRNRNGRAFVSIIDFKTLHDPGSLNCSGQEYYRVILQTLDVAPYDGCFEGAPAQRVLPTLKRLPG
jgi:hypothetical protein